MHHPPLRYLHRPESVVEHSWRIALMAMLLREELPEADMDKVIKMCLIHDLGEAFTGDISTWLPLEYDLQLNYADESSAFYPYLKALDHAVDT